MIPIKFARLDKKAIGLFSPNNPITLLKINKTRNIKSRNEK
jgi:hypothetical protein